MSIDLQNNPQLIKDYLRGEVSVSDELKLVEWINSSEQNYVTFKRYIEENQFNQIHTDETNQSWKKLRDRLTYQDKNNIKKKVVVPVWLKVAAIFIISFTLGIFAYYIYSSGTNIHLDNQLTNLIEINAPKGSKSFVGLPDGSKVWLNSDSKLFYSPEFGKKDRVVELEGEAYFDVEKNTVLPFQVNAAGIVINVTGTMFNLKAYPNENTIETTLEEGEVIIEKREGKRINKVATLKPMQRAVIKKAGNKIVVSDSKVADSKNKSKAGNAKEKQPIVVQNSIDTKVYTSWKENRLVFRDEGLPAVLVRLERWYGVKFNVKDEEILNYHFNGTIENETVTQVMKVIQFALPIQFEIEQNLITIQKND